MEDKLIYTMWMLRHYGWKVITYDLVSNLAPKMSFDPNMMAHIPKEDWEAARVALINLRGDI